MTGWTQLDSVVAGDMRTVFWTKVVQAGDPGTQVTVPLSGTAKYTLTVAAYTGVDPTPGLTFARAADTANHANRVTPAVTAPEGAWVVSYWADKSSTTTAWTPAGSVTGRQMLCGADGGRICSLFADSGSAVAGRALRRRSPPPRTPRRPRRPPGRSCWRRPCDSSALAWPRARAHVHPLRSPRVARAAGPGPG